MEGFYQKQMTETLFHNDETRSLSRKMSHQLGCVLFEITLLFHRFARI